MRNSFLYIAVAIMLTVLASCSKSPVEPLIGDTGIQTQSPGKAHTGISSDNTMLWGLWDVYFNEETQTFNAVPIRGADTTLNVVKFLNKSASNLIVKFKGKDSQPTYTDISIDVGIKHPFPGLTAFTGFDVQGVFLGDGDDVYPGPDGFQVAGENNPQLLNADGYTRRFNYAEYGVTGETWPLFGFYPGNLGTKDFFPTAELNPYKYFAEGMGPEDYCESFLILHPELRGSFEPGTVNYRRYELRFPINPLGIKFQYAVIAHWEPNVNHPDPPASLDDFPIEANADEAVSVRIENYSDLFYVSPSEFGGMVHFLAFVIDWSAVPVGGIMEEYQLKCYSSAWAGDGAIDMHTMGGGDNFYEFPIDIPATTLSSNEPLKVRIEVSYPGLDYTNKNGVPNDATGPLASYFVSYVPVSNIVPYSVEVTSPNGGENLQAGGDFEITWNSEYIPGTVYIDYSKDDFGSDIHSIATDETNDGSFLWENIPDDPSSTVRVRVTSSDISSATDMSDDYFTILPEVPSGWARSWGGVNDRALGVAVDSDGNSYTTGYFKTYAPTDFDPGDGEDLHESNGWAEDVFLSKFDKNGNYIWARTWGSDDDDEGHGVEVDSEGNIYVTGFFRYTVDFDTGTGSEERVASGSEDVFLSKFDSDGNFLWVQTWGSSENANYNYYPFYGDGGEHVAVDGSDNVYVACDQGAPGIRKYTPDGTFEWSREWGTMATWDKAYGVAVTNDGNVYVVGRFQGTVDFNPGGGDSHTANGWDDSYLCKYDTNGTYYWCLTWGGIDKTTGYSDPPYYVDCSYGVAADNAGGVYVAGIFYGETDFDTGPGQTKYTADEYGDAYVAKYDAGGNFQWVRVLQGQHFQEGYGVEVDDAGDLYLTGRFYYTVDFDPGPGVNEYTSAGDCDMFLSKYDTDGNWDWARTWGATWFDVGAATDIDPDGNSYMAGYFGVTVDFDPGPGVDEHTASTFEDCVLVKLLPNGYWE